MTLELSSKYRTEIPESFVGAQQGLGASSETNQQVMDHPEVLQAKKLLTWLH
jgi:hypothetical protein